MDNIEETPEIRGMALIAAALITKDNDPIRVVEFASHFRNFIIGQPVAEVAIAIREAFYTRVPSDPPK